MRQIIYGNRAYLLCGMICSGWDPYNGYQIYSVNPSGFMDEGDWKMSGSGSSYIYGFMDSNYRKDMSKAEVTEFLKTAIQLGCYRDGSSGGCVRLLNITKEGVQREFIPYGDFMIK